MKRSLLLFGTLIGSMSFAQDCSDLFISEYVEGWSNNKALEIYNPTPNTIDLSQYVVIRYSNGATSATSANAIQLVGTIAPYDVHVGVIDKRDPQGSGQEAPVWDSLQARADEFYCPDYNTSNAWYWNGNDCIALAMGSVNDIGNVTLVDFFGKLGENPGNGSDPETGWTSAFPYTGNGDGVTVDHSMIRKSSIMNGNTNFNPSFFDPLAEWDSIPAVVDIGGQLYGNWFSLGEHDCDCATASTNDIDALTNTVKVYPNPTTGQFWVKGIANYTEIRVVNALGQEVATVANKNKTIVSFDVNAHRGVYFVKLTNEAGDQLTKRVIIK